MSFTKLSRIRNEQELISKSISDLPKKIESIAQMFKNIFTHIDKLNNVMEDVILDINPEYIDSIDNSLSGYKSIKREIERSFKDLEEIGNRIAESQSISGMNKGIDEALLTDVQDTIQGLDNHNFNLHSQLSNSITSHFETVKAKSNADQDLIQSSFEIYTKITFQLLQHSTELVQDVQLFSSNLDMLMGQYETQGEVQQTLLSNQNEQITQIQGIFSEINQLKKDSTDIKAEITSLRTDIFPELLQLKELINSLLTKFDEKIPKVYLQSEQQGSSFNKTGDSHEIRNFLNNFLYEWPSDKRLITRKLEEFRDVLLTERDQEAPYRVTASSIFREAISIIQREENPVKKSTIRDVIRLFERLKTHVLESN